MGKKLAIQGHLTRGKEVIELLEMMGGKNCYNLNGLFSEYAYYIIEGFGNEIRGGKYILGNEDMHLFALEEFLEKYPYKVGDKVNQPCIGCVKTITSMKWDEYLDTVSYKLDNKIYTRIEQLKVVNDLPLVKNENLEETQTKRDIDKTVFMFGPVMVPDKVDDKLEYEIIDGYEFERVENGKIILKPIKPKYPDNYEECVRIAKNIHGYDIHIDAPDYRELMESFIKLLICRDAYWKIAGEQMGLGKPWEHNYLKDANTIRYAIYNTGDEIVKLDGKLYRNYILCFPIKELRDAFYEKFKDLIESCKELL